MPLLLRWRCWPLREKENLSGDCTDTPGGECHKGESLDEDDANDGSAGHYVAYDDANNDDANKDDANHDNKASNNDDEDDEANDDDYDSDCDDDEFLSMPVLKYFEYFDILLQ